MLVSDWPKPPTKQPITFQPQRCCMCVRKKRVWARERESGWDRGEDMVWRSSDNTVTSQVAVVQWAESQTGSATGENAVSNHRAADCCCAFFFVNEELNLGFRCDVTARSPLWMVVSPWQQALRLMVNGVRCTLHTLLSKTRLVFALMMFWLNTNVENSWNNLQEKDKEFNLSPPFHFQTSGFLLRAREKKKKSSFVISQEDICYILLHIGPKLVPWEDAPIILNDATFVGPWGAHLPLSS